ncbi:MAG: cupin-like domain-containing protein [Steroidobacteraceae bacterium]
MQENIWTEMPSVREWKHIDRKRFEEEIVPLNRPAVIRGLVNHWPAVNAARESPQALAEFVRPFSKEQPVTVLHADAGMRGRFFYDDALQGLNFKNELMTIGGLLTRLLQGMTAVQGPALYAGAVPVVEHLPKFGASHSLEMLDSAIPCRTALWIGNRTRAAAHFDESSNVICVIGGRRRYTLFSPEQIRNLYFGPLDRTPAGVPISMVDFARPDYQRFPRFRTALENAEVAELNPGDALYMPTHWVHQGESLDSFGLMMNFWWQASALRVLSPYFTLMHSLITMRGLTPVERAAWRAVFDVYVFNSDCDPAQHLPEASRGILNPLTPVQVQGLIGALQESLDRARRNLLPPGR